MLQMKKLWTASRFVQWREVVAHWTKQTTAGIVIMLLGMVVITLLIIALD